MSTARPSVLITGGAKRIGASLSKGFAGAGYHVIIHYHTSEDAARELAASLSSAEVVGCDLADGGAAQAMIKELAARHTDWRVLINSASVFEFDDARAADAGVFTHAMQVNALVPMLMAQTYLSHAKAQAGRRVIQFTDQKLANPNPDFFSYTMSKYAVAGALKMLAMIADSNDRVYGLAPGAILPSFDQSEEETEKSHVLNLLSRKTNVQEVVDGALFLSNGHLKTGSTLFIDSGQHLLNQPRDVIYLARN